MSRLSKEKLMRSMEKNMPSKLVRVEVGDSTYEVRVKQDVNAGINANILKDMSSIADIFKEDIDPTFVTTVAVLKNLTNLEIDGNDWFEAFEFIGLLAEVGALEQILAQINKETMEKIKLYMEENLAIVKDAYAKATKKAQS